MSTAKTSYHESDLPRARPGTIVKNIKPCPDDYAGLITESVAAALDLSLERPRFVQADRADWMREDDHVVGLRLGSETRCYPFWIWDYHHIVNDEWQGHPVFVAG